MNSGAIRYIFAAAEVSVFTLRSLFFVVGKMILDRGKISLNKFITKNSAGQ